MWRWLTTLYRKLFEPKPCEHDWRPCVAQLLAWQEQRPARICAKCHTWEPLTEAAFYSQFGERFYAAAKGGGPPAMTGRIQ